MSLTPHDMYTFDTHYHQLPAMGKILHLQFSGAAQIL